MNKYLLSPQRAIGLLLISASLFLFSCQKGSNDPAPEEQVPVADYLITEMDSDQSRFRFSYNEKDQVTKIELWQAYGSLTELVILQSVEYKYENGKAASCFMKFFDRFDRTWGPTSEVKLDCDQQGKIIQANYPEGGVTTYDYDAEGRLSEINSSNFGKEEFSYNAEGNVIYSNIPSDHPDYPFIFWSDMKYTTYKNPLLKNSNSLLFYIAFLSTAGKYTELFSACLPEKFENSGVIIRPPLPSGENNDFKGTNLSLYSYSFDKDGLLKSNTEKYKNQKFVGNKLDADDSGELSYKITSIKR